MLIGILSDTHIPERASNIPPQIIESFQEVELILHAGDLVSNNVLKELEDIAPTIAVQGNMDRYYGLKIPERKVMEIEGVKIGLVHGEVYPRGDTQQLRYLGLEMGVEVLISGHTHLASINELNDMILLNPGSPTVPRLSDPSVMLLEVEKGVIDAKIVKVGGPVCKALQFEK